MKSRLDHRLPMFPKADLQSVNPRQKAEIGRKLPLAWTRLRTPIRASAEIPSVAVRQRVYRPWLRMVPVGGDPILVHHDSPIRESSRSGDQHAPESGPEIENNERCLLRSRRQEARAVLLHQVKPAEVESRNPGNFNVLKQLTDKTSFCTRREQFNA